MEKYPGYLGILKWSLANTDSTVESKAEPLSPEDQAFLEQVIKEMTVDTNAIAKASIKIINLPDNPALDPADEPEAEAEEGAESKESKASGEGVADAVATPPAAAEEVLSEPVPGEPVGTTLALAPAAVGDRPPVTIEQRKEAKVEALRSLLDYVHQIDCAMNMIPLGGLDALVVTVRSSHEELRALGMEVLAMTVQNNPKTQVAALALGLLDTSMRMIGEDTIKVRTKALLCLSALVADSAEAQAAFAARGGWPAIGALLGVDDARLLRKAVFFCLHMVYNEAQAVAAAAAGVPLKLGKFVAHDNVDLRENSQSAIVKFVEAVPAVRDALAANPEFVERVTNRNAALITLMADPEEAEYVSEEAATVAKLVEMLS